MSQADTCEKNSGSSAENILDFEAIEAMIEKVKDLHVPDPTFTTKGTARRTLEPDGVTYTVGIQGSGEGRARVSDHKLVPSRGGGVRITSSWASRAGSARPLSA